MNKISAAEILEKNHNKYSTLRDYPQISGDAVKATKEAMIEFAKLHVKAALKSAADEIELNRDEDLNGVSIDTSSIFNAYPDSNII